MKEASPSVRLSRFSAPLLGQVTSIGVAAEPAPAGFARWRPLVLWGLLAVGVLLRVWQFLPGADLCYDEAALAVNLAHRSYGQLLEPLDFNQGAPIGFLLAEKALLKALGRGERAARLLPFVCAVVSLLIFPSVARRFVSPNAVLIATALFALGRPVIYYSAQLKQYSSDVLIALSLTWLAASLIERREGNRPASMLLWGILGALAIWCTHTAVFVLAGSGMAYALLCVKRRDWGGLGAFGGAAAVWLFSFAACYFLFLKKLVQTDYLLTFWQADFMPLPPRSPGELQWFIDALIGILNQPVGLAIENTSLAGVGALALVVGVVCLFSQRPFLLATLGLPILCTLLASGLHKYPFGNRLILFLVPALLLVIAAGAEEIRARTWRDFRLLGAAFLVLLLSMPVLASAGRLVQPTPSEPVKSLLHHLHEHRQPGDSVYVYTTACPAYLYYGPEQGVYADSATVLGTGSGDWGKLARELDQLRGQRRVWVFLTQHQRWASEFRTHLDQIGHRRDAFVPSDGAALYLYEMKGE